MSVVAFDDFEAYALATEVGTLADWTAFHSGTGPNFFIRDDGPGGSKSAKAEAGGWNWLDYNPAPASLADGIISCRMESTAGRLNLSCRVTGHSVQPSEFPNDGYMAQFNAGANTVQILRHQAADSVVVLACASVPAYGADNIIKFRFEGPNLEAFIDGVSVLTAIDSTHLGAGKPVVGNFHVGNDAWCDDFTVEDIVPADLDGRGRRGRR